MLPTLIAIVLTVMGIIKPSIFIKNKEIKWKRLKIGAFGTVISLVSLMIFCGFFAAEPENQNQHQASTQTPSQEQAEIQKNVLKKQLNTVLKMAHLKLSHLKGSY